MSNMTGLILGLISIILILFGALHIVSNKKPYYLPEGFTTEAIDSTEREYPTDPLNEIKNPLLKIVKKLGKISLYFADPKIWIEAMKISKMSIKDLAIHNLNKEKILSQLKKF